MKKILQHESKDVQSSFHNGTPTYWLSGNDFVLFLEKEGNSVNEAHQALILGKVTANTKDLPILRPTVTVSLAVAK